MIRTGWNRLIKANGNLTKTFQQKYYNAPDKWGSLFPIAANGKRQSPIDLNTKNLQNKAFPKLEIHYDPKDLTSVVNSGHSVTFSTSGSNSAISGGPLAGRHRLLQFHFHWGAENDRGSEHTLNGQSYSAEMHLVHLNEKYKSFNEALEHEDGLCVLGVFLQVGDSTKSFDKIAEYVNKVPHKGMAVDIAEGLEFESMLPSKRDEYTFYSGSLTTPPLSECVQWINFTSPVFISEKQISSLRKLCSNEKEDADVVLVDNFRPVQPIHNRCLVCNNH